MNAAKLSKAIRSLRNEVGDYQDDHMTHDDPDYGNINDARGLLSVLANIVEGMPIERAFGSPGDWGHETEIGAAIADRS
jgi:Cys-tRNA synthase (O-phospho-L-seryl-tRNA:Cys-tRNA synthase)